MAPNKDGKKYINKVKKQRNLKPKEGQIMEEDEEESEDESQQNDSIFLSNGLIYKPNRVSKLSK